MSRIAKDTDNHIGRRLKLRDLQILACVAEYRSMAKAATHLATTQPTVSQAIADLEDAVGVRLFDRSTQGVMPTVYGDILLKRGAEAFDALKQGLRDIEYVATPGAGDVWIGCAEPALHGYIPAVIHRLAQHHPKIVVHAADVNPAENEFHRLRDRKLDLMIGRSTPTQSIDDLNVETLFEETFVVVTAVHNPWARRRKVTLNELMNESWIFGESSNSTQALISEVFHAKAGGIPPISVYSTSMNLRLALLTSGNYLSCIPISIYRSAQGRPLKALPVDMGLKLPVALFTLKNRTLSPVVQIFIEAAREVAKTMEHDH